MVTGLLLSLATTSGGMTLRDMSHALVACEVAGITVSNARLRTTSDSLGIKVYDEKDQLRNGRVVFLKEIPVSELLLPTKKSTFPRHRAIEIAYGWMTAKGALSKNLVLCSYGLEEGTIRVACHAPGGRNDFSFLIDKNFKMVFRRVHRSVSPAPEEPF